MIKKKKSPDVSKSSPGEEAEVGEVGVGLSWGEESGGPSWAGESSGLR